MFIGPRAGGASSSHGSLVLAQCSNKMMACHVARWPLTLGAPGPVCVESVSAVAAAPSELPNDS